MADNAKQQFADVSAQAQNVNMTEFKLKGSVKEPNILIYFFFPPITQSCSLSDVLFTGGVSDLRSLKYY